MIFNDGWGNFDVGLGNRFGISLSLDLDLGARERGVRTAPGEG